MTRTPLRLLLLTVVAALVAVILPASAQAAPYCGITWGSLAKSANLPSSNLVLDVRAGRHACFDRLVVDLGGRSLRFASYDVRYVSQVHEDGRGNAIPVRGAADLQVIVRAPAYSGSRATYLPANPREVVDVSAFPTFRQVAWAGTFEGQTTLALGVRARLPFRVMTLDALPGSEQGPRLVIDVARSW